MEHINIKPPDVINASEAEFVEEICRRYNSHDDLLAACKAQCEAIDRLFARLIEVDKSFFPSKSGQPWQAISQGNAAIAKTETAHVTPD